MSDDQTSEFWQISSYDLMETRLKCLELSIKALTEFGAKISDDAILGLAHKFTEFVLQDMKVTENS